MGVPSTSFIDTYPGKVNDLMISLVEYVQAIDRIRNPPNASQPTSNPGGGTNTDTIPIINPLSSIQLEKNLNGYPILPDPIPSEGWKKGSWDRLFTDYLGELYQLACGGKDRHIPYKRIGENQKEYIDPKYLPRKTTFKPPRNITVLEMKGIFEHFLQRQKKYGPEDAFKFKSIKLKGETVPALYKSDSIIVSSVPGPGSGPGPSPGPELTTNCPTPSGPSQNLNDNPVTNSNTNSKCRQPLKKTKPQKKTKTSSRSKSGSGPIPSSEIETQNNPKIIKNSNSSTAEQSRPRPRPRPLTRRITRSTAQGLGPEAGNDSD
jgi:hypothetical protein